MRCDEHDWTAFLKGELPDAEAERLRLHAGTCESCRLEQNRVERTLAALGGMGNIEPSPDFRRRVRQAFLEAYPEFAGPSHDPEEKVSLWRSFFAPFPAWAVSVAAHIVVLAALTIFFLAPPDSDALQTVEIPLLVPRVAGEPWLSERETGGALPVAGVGRDREIPEEDLELDFEQKRRREESPDFVERPGGRREPPPIDPGVWQRDRLPSDPRVLGFLAARKDDGVRARLHREHGVPGDEEAVRSALRWLSEVQNGDGSWPTPILEKEDHGVGVTGLALLAFLGEGETHRKGSYVSTVSRGVQYLLSQQKETGLLGRADSNCLYDHAIAATALLEAQLLESDEALRSPVISAVRFTIAAQNPVGGWGYAPGSPESDTSVGAWQIVLLRLSHSLQPDLPLEALYRAREALSAATDSSTGRVGYRVRGQYPHREFGMTAAGMTAHLMSRPVVEEELLSRQAALLLSEGQPRVERAPARFDSNDLYFWFFGSIAMFQRGDGDWDRWRTRLLPELIAAQEKDGGWPAAFDKWALYGGRVYTTAMATLILESVTRYPRFVR